MRQETNVLNQTVPIALRTWFVVHFIADIIFAIPLMIAPRFTLELMGWQTVDVLSARIVAAALFGIGIESYLGRNSGKEAFIGMLNLKIIWSVAVIVGGTVSMLEGAQGRPPMAWGLIIIFALFNVVWIYWRRKLT
ncbi:MAG: hypothetical protein N2D54_00985 [Chloroflexota bacterium]